MQDTQVDLNAQIRLMKRPSPTYPASQEDVFQLKYVPPVPIDELLNGQVVVRNLFLSIDATMRVWISGAKSYMEPVGIGEIMKGQGIAEVIYSKSKKFVVGDRVLGLTRWEKYSVLSEKGLIKLPKEEDHIENYLGVLGISGLTAYMGLHKIGNIKSGDSLVVSAAAGAVGQIALQLAKLHGCTVCGIAGDEAKCAYLKTIGADYTINYKKESIRQKLKQYFPSGVDVYFDNVGGQMLDDLLMHIKDESRIVMCGTISNYNSLGSEGYRLKNYSRLIIKRATMQGFLYFDYYKQFPQAIAELKQLVDTKKMTYRVDLMHGLEEAPKGLRRLLKGDNAGKVIVQVDNHIKPKL